MATKKAEDCTVSVHQKLGSIEQKVDGIQSWVKELAEQQKITNNRTRNNEQQIAVIKHTISDLHQDFQGFENEEKSRNSALESMSREKLFWFAGIGATFGFFVLNVLWEIVKKKLFGG